MAATDHTAPNDQREAAKRPVVNWCAKFKPILHSYRRIVALSAKADASNGHHYLAKKAESCQVTPISK